MAFSIKTESFEGPLDLLLDLVEKRQLFINDISLAKVTDDFIAHASALETMPMAESAHFILVASTLLLIKSKSLLPGLALTEEEQGDIRGLETRLKIYKEIRDAGREVEKLFGGAMIFPRSERRAIKPVFAPDPAFSLEKAVLVLKEIADRLPKKETLPKHIVRKVITLEEMIVKLSHRIESHLEMSFKEFTKEHKKDRVNIIVGFLAMLELVKKGSLFATQNASFGEIIMETNEVGVPRY
ncbi:MAG: segregation and condensation protein [Candidatus Parcubacteria bacterium]|jgi:segregation and condensation protein A|nr:segregation and condensation protein [Candidatus Parcubacteria bacterium]